VEVDGSGKVLWKHIILNAFDAIRLPSGNTLIALFASHSTSRLVEVTPNGKMIAEVFTTQQESSTNVDTCFGLLRLGFDMSVPEDVDLATSIPFRMAGLKSKNVARRIVCALTLNELNCRAEQIPGLIEAFNDPQSTVQLFAGSALARIGSPAWPAILKATKDQRSRVRASAYRIFGSLPEKANVLPVIVEGLFDQNEEVKKGAIMAMASKLQERKQLGVPTTEAEMRLIIPPLIMALKENDPPLQAGETSVPATAAFILGTLGSAAKPALPNLIEAAGGDRPNLRPNAIAALGSLGESAKEAIPILLKAIRPKAGGDTEASVIIRRHSIWALSQMGVHAKVAIPALREALADANMEIQMEAKKALQHLQR
jgi:HEAT repeat protein